MRLGRRFSGKRLEAACVRALALSSYSYHTVKNILSAGLDRVVLEEETESRPRPGHENVRGANYYDAGRGAMLTQETIEKMNAMKLFGLVAAFDTQLSSSEYDELSFEERVGLLVDAEWSDRECRKLSRRLKAAKLRYSRFFGERQLPGRRVV